MARLVGVALLLGIAVILDKVVLQKLREENTSDDKVREENTIDDKNPAIPADAAFPQFRHLPAEIQHAIWDAAAASPILTPEYAAASDWVDRIRRFWRIVHDATLLPSSPALGDPMVLTSWSPLMHTCFDSRAAALRSPALPLSYSWGAGFPVPCRPFDPTIDALYLPQITRYMANDLRLLHPQFHNFFDQATCLVPIDEWTTLKEMPVPPKFKGYREFRTAKGHRPNRFNPRESITTRRRMRLVRVPAAQWDSLVLVTT